MPNRGPSRATFSRQRPTFNLEENAHERRHEFAPDLEKLVLGGPAPLVATPDGKYPVPNPGLKSGEKKREYRV